MRRRFVPILALVAVTGCDRSPPPPPRVPATQVAGSGVIEGRVTFDGIAPAREIIRNEPCCPGAPPTQLSETVVVNDNGTLANVFVYLENGPRTEGSALAPVLLDQQFCRYVPHVVGVVVDQPLKLKSDDPTMHNVNIRPAAGPAINEWMTYTGETKTVSLAEPGFARSKCDVHPWMAAVVGVFDNPFFAITDGQGRYEIRDVPDGDYTLVTWHEFYSIPLRQTVVVHGGRVTTADFRYHPPTP